MKNKFYLITIICLAIILTGWFNAPPDGHTGAPGDSLCTACHGGSNPFGFDGNVEISGPGPLVTPGQTYTVSVKVSNPNGLAQRAGFQIVALDENNDNIGTLSNPSPNSTLSTQGGRTYFKHNPGQNFPGSNEVEWTVDWTAPSMTSSEIVTFYGAGNIADGNGQNTNDFIVTTELEIDIEPAGDPLEIEIVSSMDISCSGGMDGMAEAHASGGQGPYSYLWSNGETGPVAVQLSAGISEVTVTDDAGSTESTTVDLSEPEPLEVVLNDIGDVSCFGGADGFISVSGQGGVGGYLYSWSHGASGGNISNLSTGNYEVVLTDGNNCTTSEEYFISEPDPIVISKFVEDASCNGLEDGEILLGVSGGTLPYSAVWSDGSEGLILENLSAGDYSYTLTDANDCQAFGQVTVDEPDPISVSEEVVDVSCNGLEEGEISLDVSGGTAPYTAVWSNGSEGLSLVDLSAGNYSYTLTDGNDCEATGMVTVNEPSPISLSISFTNPSCPNCEDGSAMVSASGGVGNYTYLWNTDPPQNTAGITDLSAGTYAVTVTDGNDCSSTANVTLTDPDDCITGGGFYYNQNTIHCTKESLENLCFELPDSIQQDSLFLCDTVVFITNPLWYNFVAGDSLFHILANIDSCANENGVRIGLFELACELSFDPGSQGVLPAEADLMTSCDLLLTPQTGEIEIEAVLEPGKVYGLMVEGWESDQCHFAVTEVIQAEDAPDLSILDWHLQEIISNFPGWQPDSPLCLGAKDVQFQIEDTIQAGCHYIWTLENLSDSSVIDVSITPASQNLTTFDFPESGDFLVCVVSSNHCSTTLPVCTELTVSQLDPAILIDTICKRVDYQWFGPFGEVLETYDGFEEDWGFGMDPNPDPFEDVKITENQFGCVVDALLELYVIPDNYLPTHGDEEYFQEVICFGESFEMPDGSQYTQTGIYGTQGEIFIPQQTYPQCDSFFILELSVLEVRLSWEDPMCTDQRLTITPSTDPGPEFLPGGADHNMSIQWVRLSDNFILFTGHSDDGTFDDGLEFVLTPEDLVQDVDTFEVSIVMDIDGEPDPGCLFGPWTFVIGIDDFSPAAPEINGPESVIRDSLLALTATLPPGDGDTTLNFHWTVLSETGDYTIIHDDSTGNFELMFHTLGIHEICVYATNSCGQSETVCVDIEVEESVSVDEVDGEEWGIHIFPNPAEGHLIVESADLSGKIDIHIIDLGGKLLKTYSEVFENRTMIRVDDLPVGMYFIQIYREGASVQQSFYKK